MRKYEIQSEAGMILGVYEARDEGHAIDQLFTDAGYMDDLRDGLIIREVTDHA